MLVKCWLLVWSLVFGMDVTDAHGDPIPDPPK